MGGTGQEPGAFPGPSQVPFLSILEERKMARRTGAPSIHDVALRLCTLLGKYGALIGTLPEATPELIAALAAAAAACSVLVTEIVVVLEEGD